MEGKPNWPAVIGINGPAGSGKSHLVKGLLKELIPDAVVFRPSDRLFEHMKLNGAVPHGIEYGEYKKLFGAREKLISYAAKIRAIDPTAFVRDITSMPSYEAARVVIVDNIGDDEEALWFTGCSSVFLLLRLDTKFLDPEPRKARGRRLVGPWPRDSRKQVTTRYQLTAYDSLQMTLFLRWLTAPTLTREEAGPYNEHRELWHNIFGLESTRLIHAPGHAGELGRLDAPAREESSADSIDFGLEPRGGLRKGSRHKY